MEILGEKGIGKILKIFLQVCFWGGIAVLTIFITNGRIKV